jgi:predicted RNase H-like HicB family nuclease
MMLYPVYVHSGDDKHAHGITLPDFPGCFSAADKWDDIARSTQEAVELYFDGEDITVPEPTSLDDLMNHPDYQGGVWVLVDIDMSRVQGKTKRINITVPVHALRTIDQAAEKAGESRSWYLVKSALSAVEKENKR